MGDWIFLIIGIAVLGVVALVGLVATGRRRQAGPSPGGTGGTDVIVPPPAESTRRSPMRQPEVVRAGRDPAPTAPTVERPEGTASRLVRLRQRLAGSQGGLGRGLLALLSRDRLDEDTWESIEDTLLTADVGVAPTQELVERLRTRLRVEGDEAEDPRTVLREELLDAGRPDHGPAAPGERRRRTARRRAGRRRQRLRQDHHGRQDRPDPGRRGPHGRARRRRHLPRRRRRAAGHLGRAGRRRRRPRPRGHRPGQRRVRGGQGGRRRPAPTPSSSTPPVGCRTRPA